MKISTLSSAHTGWSRWSHLHTIFDMSCHSVAAT